MLALTVRCIMEAWNKRNPLTEHYFEETTRPLTCLNLLRARPRMQIIYEPRLLRTRCR